MRARRSSKRMQMHECVGAAFAVRSRRSRKEIAMNKLSVIVLLTLAAPCLALGQATSAQPPKPGPEHQKLAGLVGNWTTEGEATENPFGPAEKWSAKIASEWFSGNFAVVRHLDGKGSVSGESRGLDVIAYD